MTSRGIVFVALWSVAVVAILAWALLTAPDPPVKLVFLGYRTNHFDAPSVAGVTNVSTVSAIFGLTNGSGREITFTPRFGKPLLQLELKTPQGWSRPSNYLCSVDGNSRSLSTGAVVHCSVFVEHFDQPLRASVDYYNMRDPNNRWDRLMARLQPRLRTNTTTITIQDR